MSSNCHFPASTDREVMKILDIEGSILIHVRNFHVLVTENYTGSDNLSKPIMKDI